ncbi:MAG: PAS domain-containing protein [Candidatus Sericytochromatia bacterium]|nr:PAS domain-containing protein [Candidatus Sericytochromatia bacterium]
MDERTASSHPGLPWYHLAASILISLVTFALSAWYTLQQRSTEVLFALGTGLLLLLAYNIANQRNTRAVLRNLSESLQTIRQHREPEPQQLARTGVLKEQVLDLAQYVQRRVMPDQASQMVPVNLEKNELESIIHCMNDGLIIYDMNMNVVLLNPALAELLIPSNPAATGRLIQNPDDQLLFERCVNIEHMKQVHRAMTEEPLLPRCDVIELQHPPQFLKRYASPLNNRFHQQIGHVIIYHDITQEVQSERIRAEFITNASHELRTPVTSIKLLLETLDGGAKDDPKVRGEFIRNLLREADRLHILVNDLLDLSRLETAHERLAWSELELRKVVHDSLQTIAPLAQKKGVDLKENIEDDLQKIWADQLRLGQVLINLVNNAVKFTPSGGEVRVIVRRVDESVEFKIQDTGIGIPQEDLPYIFDRFYRVEQNRQRRQNSGGSGLGLTISKQVVEMHGGKITVSSSPKGTVFTFTIPQKVKVNTAVAS